MGGRCRGTICATTNGGTTWKAEKSGVTDTLFGVAFAGASAGWAVGCDPLTGAGVVLATTNGGTTWKAQDSGVTDALFAVAFADRSDGWTVGLAGTVLATTDGGATWRAQDSGTSSYFEGVAVANASDGWLVGQGGMIRASTNGGWPLLARLTLKLGGLKRGILKLGGRVATTGQVTPTSLARETVTLVVKESSREGGSS